MIDVHPHPESACCDGPQALLPAELAMLAARMWELAAWMGREVPEIKPADSDIVLTA